MQASRGAFSLCVRYWPKADIPIALVDVGLARCSGHAYNADRESASDPEQTFQSRSMRLRRFRPATRFRAVADLSTEGCEIGRTSHIYSASASQKLSA